MRRVRLIGSPPTLNTWIKKHPFKDDPNAYLWLRRTNEDKNDRKTEPMDYSTALALLRRLFQRAGIRKSYNAHLFRHSRATHLANDLTEAQMKEVFGWTQGSQMAATYVHLSGRDVDNAMLEIHGLAKDEGKKGEKYKVKICPRCDEQNSPSVEECVKCGTTLDIKTLLEEDEKRNVAEDLLSELISDKRVKDAMVARIEELDERDSSGRPKTGKETFSEGLMKLLGHGLYDIKLTAKPVKSM